MIPFNTPNTSIIELLQPIQVKIQGLTQTIDFPTSSRFQRVATTNLQTQNLDIRWYIYNCTDEIQDLIATTLEEKFEDLNTQEFYFVEYIPPFVDIPEISQIEPMTLAGKASYTIRLTFATPDEAEAIRQHLFALSDAKTRLFESNGKETVPSVLEALKSIACCSSEIIEEVATPTQEWTQL